MVLNQYLSNFCAALLPGPGARVAVEAAPMCDVSIQMGCVSSTGFSVAHTVNEVFIPTKVDLETGDVQISSHEVHYFR